MTEEVKDEQASAEAAEEPRREVEQVDRSDLGQPARLSWDPRQIAAIKKTVAAECNDAEFVMFTEVASRYQLDPFAKQIFAAKIKGRVQIIVSRDGLLAHAHRQDSFVKMDGDYVCANDDFKSVFKDGKRQIEHSFSTKSDPATDSEPDSSRGPLIGAWAQVVREGHGVTFFFANLSEYMQDRDGPWQKTPAAMILKCAETYALRKAFSVSGVVGEDEIEKERKRLTEVGEQSAATPELDQVPRGPYIRELAAIANQIVPNSYMPSKLMALAHDPDGLVDELSRFIDDQGGDVPAEPIEGEAEEVDAVATTA